jgi:hypothetical protein
VVADAVSRLRAARDHGPTGAPRPSDQLIAMV